MSNLSERVPIPPIANIVAGLSSARESTMLRLFGKPGALTRECSDPAASLKPRLKFGVDVGPFKVSGLDFAVASLAQVLEEVRQTLPDVFSEVKTAGMLCVRGIKHNPTHFSNHSWGAAIDLFFGSAVVPQGVHLAHRGNTMMASIFAKHGWFWGAGFQGDAVDTMHFELADETVLKMPPVDHFHTESDRLA
jgi:hypothetical protein